MLGRKRQISDRHQGESVMPSMKNTRSCFALNVISRHFSVTMLRRHNSRKRNSISNSKSSRKRKNGMCLNDRLSGERKCPSELSMTVMGKLILQNSKTLPERSESVLRYTVYFTEDFSAIAAPCTRIITIISQSWTPKTK